MNSKRFLNILCTLLCICTVNNSYSQMLFEEENTYLQRTRIGLVDEFIKRFNGDISHPDISFKDSTCRIANLLYMIEPPQDITNKDSIYNKAVKFAETIIKDSVRLNYSDSTWVALAKCKGVLDKKQVSFHIYLNVEHRKEDMYKWVIARVEGKCFNTIPRDTINNVMLYPDDHETKFMSLGRMTKEQPFNVCRFMSKGFQYDATSTFVYLVNTNKLQIDYVEELEFIFTQVPGYIFSIKYFERDSNKSGWLIDEFSTISTDEKKNYLQSLNLKYCEDTTIKNTIDVNVAEEDCIQQVDSNTLIVNSPKEVFLSRIAEYKLLCVDYMSILQSADNKDDVAYYQRKLLNLYAPNSYAHVRNTDNGNTKKMSIIELFENVSKHKYKTISVEAITVPVWDSYLIENSTSNKVQLKTIIEQINVNDSVSLNESNQIIEARQELTEDGKEWIPLLGNVYISVN